MVKGRLKTIDKPVVNYRKIDALNYSMLKKFDEDPVKFFEEFKLGKVRKEKKGSHFIIGDLVDFYLLECDGDEEVFENRFDEKFVLYDGIKGSGQVFVLVDLLFEETQNSLSESGETTTSFDTRFSEAFKRVQGIKDGEGNQKYFKGKTEDKALEIFEKDGKDYFNTLISNIGKIVLDLHLIEKAKTVANNILTDPFTRHLFYKDDNIEVLNHFPIEWKYVLGSGKFISCKSEIDRLVVDHTNKMITIYDLKTVYDNEIFEFSYIKNSYYLQAAFYYRAVVAWLTEQEGMSDYIAAPVKFIVGDTSVNNRRPLIYTLTTNDMFNALQGFEIRGNKYRGVSELIGDIVWAEENDEWRCSKQAFDNQGVIGLNINYD